MLVEDIKKKWYQDIDDKLFLLIAHLDPTSIIKKRNVVKLGMYCKWLFVMYRKKQFEELIRITENIEIFKTKRKLSDNVKKELFDSIFMYHYWYKRKHKLIDKDKNIFNYNLLEFVKRFSYVDKEEKVLFEKYHNQKGKVGLIYEDENIVILEPLDFIACYHLSKKTQWCTKSENSYKYWSTNHILLRFIVKKTKEIFRLTWSLERDDKWSWSTPVYPEYDQYTFQKDEKRSIKPFEFDKLFLPKFNVDRYEFNENSEYYEKQLIEYEKDLKKFEQLRTLFSLINDTAVKKIEIQYEDRKIRKNRI